MTGFLNVSLLTMCLLRTVNIWSFSSLYTRMRSTIFLRVCNKEGRREGRREGGREGGREGEAMSYSTQELHVSIL